MFYVFNVSLIKKYIYSIESLKRKKKKKVKI